MPAMPRRSFIHLGAASALAQRPRAAPAERPNILLLMTDQQRGDCIGAGGHPAVLTPNLDRLAREGARFRRAYSSTPSCTPARACLLTGQAPWHHGMLGYGRVAERYPHEMPVMLGEAGYFTCAIGKNHFHPQRNPHGYEQVLLDESGRSFSIDFRSDYRSWFWSQAPNLDPDATGIGWNDCLAGEYALPERLHPTAWTGDAAVRFLETFERNQPFFLKVSFARPHSPYDPPARYMREFETAEIPPAAVGDWVDRYRPRSSEKPSLWHGDLGPQQVRHSRQGYYGSIRFIDDQIGRILEALHKLGLYESTLILFVSDHGDMLGDHHHWRKCYAYEGSARIPMLVRWPDGLIAARRGQVRDEVAELRDVMPTLLAAARIEAPESTDGGNLLEPVSGRSGAWRTYLDLEHNVCYSPRNNWNALTDGKWKYIYQALDGEEYLFDLQSDPGERRNLAGTVSYGGELRRWRARLVMHFEERGEPYLRQGQLAPRPEGNLYSPWYPSSA